MPVPNFKTQMVDPIRYRIYEIGSTVIRRRPVGLDQMKARFCAIFIIAMQINPFL